MTVAELVEQLKDYERPESDVVIFDEDGRHADIVDMASVLIGRGRVVILLKTQAHARPQAR